MKNNRYLLLVPVIIFSGTLRIANANIIHVPADYASIQAAIVASVSGDTVAVSPGTYYENINLRGKNILLTSLFYIAHDTGYICSTVIDGSQPAFPDTATCIIINSGEDQTAIIQGFTITGGAGTAWTDMHGAGIFREGGGILVELSSPTIRYNHIVNNVVTNNTGVSSTGGGGIRCGDGSPIIHNNFIAFNEARYGGGVVFNYCYDVYLRNNLIACNSGGQSFGGGGVWATGSGTSSIIYVENNTIANNHVTGTGAYGGKGGGIFVFGVSINARNNILWGNTQSVSNSVVAFLGGVINVEYCDLDLSMPGTGNINADPMFTDTITFMLSSSSPGIDAGDPAASFNDLTASPNTAAFPSQGNERNDLGVYGGPLAISLPSCGSGTIGIDEATVEDGIRIYPNPATESIKINSPGQKIRQVELYHATGTRVLVKTIGGNETTISVNRLAPGIYFLRIISTDLTTVRKIEVE